MIMIMPKMDSWRPFIVAFCKTVDAHLLKLLLMLECPCFNILSSNKDHVQSFLNCRNAKISIKVQHFIMMHILDLGLHLICSISNDTKILPGCKYQSDASSIRVKKISWISRFILETAGGQCGNVHSKVSRERKCWKPTFAGWPHLHLGRALKISYLCQ